jgi:hypothetical protein
MLKRIFIAIVLVALFFVLDWASSSYSGGIVFTTVKFVRGMKSDEWIAAATVVIAIFTTVLGLFVVNLARSTRIAAQAATKAADAAVAAERARFYVVEIEDNFMTIVDSASSHKGSGAGQQLTTIPTIKVQFRNYGKTPGTIQSICCNLKFSREPFDYICQPLPVKEEIVERDRTTVEPITCVIEPLTLSEGQEIARGAAFLWLYGQVYYKDVFESPHVHRFYRRFTRLTEYRFGIRAYEYKDYNKST